MQGRFAHISDSHIGAWRDPNLRRINDLAFGSAIDLCLENQVDFVVISGDIFDTGIPEMSSVRSAVRKLRELTDRGIIAYVVYGSHDYSPTTVSVVEVLTAAGLFVNVGEFLTTKDGKIVLRPAVDGKTGTRISGLPARKRGIEKGLYSELDHSDASEGSNFSIFVFHASISELQSLNIHVAQNVSLEELPKGFSYYAGGHLHKRSSAQIDDSPVVYPGPLFGTTYTDLEQSAKGERRGFAIVDFDGPRTSRVRFVDLDLPRILSRTFTGNHKSSDDLAREIHNFASKEPLQVENSIILLKVRGVLSSGRPSDFNWHEYKSLLLRHGAAVVNINRMGLSSQETKRTMGLASASREEIETKILNQHMRGFKPESEQLVALSSDSGVDKAARLLRALKTERRSEETRQTFEGRIWKEARQILDLPPANLT